MLLSLLLLSVLVWHVGVHYRVFRWCYSATFSAAIPCSLLACKYQLLWYALTVRGQTQEAHEVYEGSGEIEPAAELAGGVVEGECVVVVVEAFAWKPTKTGWVFVLMSTTDRHAGMHNCTALHDEADNSHEVNTWRARTSHTSQDCGSFWKQETANLTLRLSGHFISGL